MALKLIVNVDNTADLLSASAYGSGALLRLERGAEADLSDASEIATTDLVSGTHQYEIWDASGTTSDYYRTRVSDSGNTSQSGYSDIFRATALQAYASLDDLLETMSVAANDTQKHNLLSDLLVRSANLIDAMCRRRFYRDPQVSGTSIWTLNVTRSRQRRLSLALEQAIDIVSVSTLEVADGTGESYTAVASGSTGYYLEAGDGITDPPYTDILLSDIGDYTTFPTGFETVRMTGVRGYSIPPELIHEANVDLAREWHRQGPGGGGPVGISALGQPIFGPGTPFTVKKAYELFRLRSTIH